MLPHFRERLAEESEPAGDSLVTDVRQEVPMNDHRPAPASQQGEVETVTIGGGQERGQGIFSSSRTAGHTAGEGLDAFLEF